MATYQYVKTDGSLGTIDAATSQQAIASAPDRKSDSGVMLYTQPTNTSQVTQTGSFQMPTNTQTDPNLSKVSGSTSYYDKLFETYQQQQQDAQKRIEEQQKIQQQQTQPFLQKLLGAPSPQETADDAWMQTGINPDQYFANQQASIAEIGKLTEEYNALVAAKDQQIAQSYDKLASMNFINNQIGQINRNAAPQLNMLAANINSKAAVMEMQQGRFAEARSFVNDAVDNATADLKFNMDMFKTFYDINQDVIDRLDQKYQQAFLGGLEASEKAYLEAKDEKEQVGELMLKYGNGITMNDTLESAMQKAGVTAQQLIDLEIREIEAGIAATNRSNTGSGSGATKETLADLDADIYTWRFEEKLSPEEMFIRAKQLYGRDLDDATIAAAVGYTLPNQSMLPASEQKSSGTSWFSKLFQRSPSTTSTKTTISGPSSSYSGIQDEAAAGTNSFFGTLFNF